MYLKSQCPIKYDNQRSKFFEFNRGVRQGCILSLLLFNLNLNEFPHLTESHDTDPVKLPNGAALNCLFCADDLMLISASVAGLQKQINILQQYCEKWLLTINVKKTKTLIFQKQNRKSTQDKYFFLLNGKEIDNVADYTCSGTKRNVFCNVLVCN